MIYLVPAVLMIKKWASILNYGLDLDSDGPRDMIMMSNDESQEWL
jgi:hypothetical protein